MFPFIIRGKVPLGLRRDYHLSEAGLEERLAERLLKPKRKSEMRVDGSPSGTGRGLFAQGMFRLQSMGFLTAVRIRKLRVISREDALFAAYEMDATASTLVSVVIIPLVLGSVLLANAKFSFWEALGILLALVLTSWGLDIFILVMMVRHEIRQVASEIRGVMLRRDRARIDASHLDLEPSELLATAYYYERNGMSMRCEAYLAHLVTFHPHTLEGKLAEDHMERLGGSVSPSMASRTREGEQKEQPGTKKRRWIRRRKKTRPSARRGRERAPSVRKADSEPKGIVARVLGLLRPLRLRGRKEKRLQARRESRGRYERGADRKAKLLGLIRRESGEERRIRRRHDHLQHRERLSYRTDRDRNSGGKASNREKVARLLGLEGREKRRARKQHERWIHGPRSSKAASNARGARNGRRGWRPSWFRTREERQAEERRRRWHQGPSGPASVQRARDRNGLWRLLARESRDQRYAKERQEMAVQDTARPET